MKYVSDTFSTKALRQLVPGNKLVIMPDENVQIINTFEKYKLSISNQAILGRLKALTDLTRAENCDKRISLVPGDEMYLIEPSDSIYQYRDETELPDTITLKLQVLKVIAE